MKKITFILTLMMGMFVTTIANAELTWGFKSPAFHYGNGYSTHVLSVEQLQYNRRKELADEAKAEANRIERELNNTTLNKFLRNVESRIYATLSKQMVDSMFAECDADVAACATSGTAEIEGSTITWLKDTTTGLISLTVVEADGTITKIEIPGSGEFNF
jgi:hypothetical protein|tara:strand:- start:726 stop:1205 length:480 start_codon:yes stop_codon:yes gene_type:complete